MGISCNDSVLIACDSLVAELLEQLLELGPAAVDVSDYVKAAGIRMPIVCQAVLPSGLL